MKCDSRVTQPTLKHRALADTEINFTTSHNYNKILESDWLPERPIFNQIRERDQIRCPLTKVSLSNNKRFI
jgi:hypothetical protein